MRFAKRSCQTLSFVQSLCRKYPEKRTIYFFFDHRPQVNKNGIYCGAFKFVGGKSTDLTHRRYWHVITFCFSVWHAPNEAYCHKFKCAHRHSVFICCYCCWFTYSYQSSLQHLIHALTSILLVILLPHRHRCIIVFIIFMFRF